MKMTAKLKLTLFFSLIILFLSGVLTWVLETAFQTEGPFGAEPPHSRIWWLDLHSVTGLWFLAIFGYLLHSHIEPCWRRRRHIKSGLLLTGGIVILFLTVPWLFYATDETTKQWAKWIHNYLGLIMPIPFFIHYFLCRRNRGR